ncbi:MAG: glycerol-3-phosphate 1-O-acyltransferase PlsY [Pseudomonadota bacterium]|nr:glycerol-3-phosphate 1-O-acyltransferase PlsY [Pseudomonadota bacterium]
MTAILLVIVAYLIGSVSFAVVASRIFKLPDPRTYGSGNPGATNVLRTGHKPAAVVTLIGDFAKGAIAVFLATVVTSMYDVPAWTIPAVALGVFVGHILPVFHGFLGGKGVATAAGVVLALHWPLGLALVVIWLTIAFGFRVSSLAALVAALVAPIGAFYSLGNTLTAWTMVPISLLLFWRHSGNIRQLFSGQERRIGR